MKTLLVLLTAACFCLVPVVTLAGNLNPTLYLEIYQYDTDPDDPEFGCVFLGTCPEICFHQRSFPGPIQCYSPKLPYQFGIVPIHIAKLATDPFGTGLAQGWPLPCGPGGGYVTISDGITRTGAAATFLGFTACPNFLAGPSAPPLDILFSATTQCHDWIDHPCYGKWMATSSVAASFFDLTGNVNNTGQHVIINCQIGTENPTVSGRAQWGGAQTVICGEGPTAVDLTTWGKIKGLYR